MSRIHGTIAISVSEPTEQDLERLGLTEDHVRHAFVELCRQVLARRGSLAYGGDLRRGGYSETLLALLRTYSDPDRPGRERIRQYLAWPVLADLSKEELVAVATHARVERVGPVDASAPRDRAAAARDYSAMRAAMTRDLTARVVVGGRTSGQTGRWPGVVEEAHLAVRAGRPLLVAGGLGGAAACVAQALRGEWPVELTTAHQQQHTPGYAELLAAGVGPSEEDLRRVLLGADPGDGLDHRDRELLQETADLDHLVALVLRGLLQLGA